MIEFKESTPAMEQHTEADGLKIALHSGRERRQSTRQTMPSRPGL
jgi:hypothetical protein